MEKPALSHLELSRLAMVMKRDAETSGGMLLTVDMVLQLCDSPHWLRKHDDDDET